MSENTTITIYVKHETEKAFLLTCGEWLPKSQVTILSDNRRTFVCTGHDSKDNPMGYYSDNGLDIELPYWLYKKIRYNLYR